MPRRDFPQRAPAPHAEGATDLHDGHVIDGGKVAVVIGGDGIRRIDHTGSQCRGSKRWRDACSKELEIRGPAGGEDGTVFAGDPRELALEVVPRMALQGGLTPQMVATIVDVVNGDWRAGARDGGAVVRALAGPPRERLSRWLRRR